MYNQQVIKTPYLMNLSCVRLLQLLYTSTNIVDRSLKTTEGRHPKIWKMLVGKKDASVRNRNYNHNYRREVALK